ncbi:MAG: putative LPS assembly protein LptD [Gemmatimonadaceae bacterium]
MRALAAAAVLLAGISTVGRAQGGVPTRLPTVRGPVRQQPAQRDTVRRAPGDTTRAGRDSTQQRELVKWAPEDSVTTELLHRDSTTATRYQADSVVFQATGRQIILNGNAAVQRDQSIIVSDTILYSDSTKIVLALGDTAILRDPAQGPADVVALGRIAYDIGNRRGVVQNVSTSVESGQTWFISAKRSFFQGDSTTRTADKPAEQKFFARNGTITSCSDEHPDYYFKSKEIKLVQGKILVARPAVLYIADVPVAWLPFMFDNLKKGTKSGIIPPRIGVADIVRNNPFYQRRVEDFGYYWAINDYLDAQVLFDWWSGARTDPNRFTGGRQFNSRFDMRYNWLDRFTSGSFGFERRESGYGNSNNYSWQHQQSFSQQTSFNANIQYSTNATATRRTQTNYYSALSSISSNANFATAFGPTRVSLGGNRQETLGGQVSLTLPTLSLTTPTVSITDWLSWTPSFNATNSLRSRLTQGLPIPVIFTPGARADSVLRRGASRTSDVTLGSPITIHNYTITLDFAGHDLEQNYPTLERVFRGTDTSSRVFSKTFETGVAFNFGFGLPQLSRGKWNIAPAVNFVNSDGSQYFWLRNEQTGGNWVHQTKRPQYAVSSTPTFFGLFPGFGPFARFRQAVTPTISYSFAPTGKPNEAFLNAQGRSSRGDLASLRQNQITLGLATNFEAKYRAPKDSATDGSDTEGAGEKIKLLSVTMDGVGYNFEQYRYLRQQGRNPKWYAGITTSTWGYRLSSDLMPNASFGARYSLFAGDVRSDTARFSPFFEGMDASFSINRRSSIFAALNRVFGGAVKNETPVLGTANQTSGDKDAQRIADNPMFGSNARRSEIPIPNTAGGWNASFTFSSSRSRPVTGATVLDPRAVCSNLVDPRSRELCLAEAATLRPDSLEQTSASRTIYVSPPRANLNANTSFNLTDKWSAQWTTDYDVEAKRFNSQMVSLRRALHDWDLVFGFNKTPYGAFSFTAFISLRAEPDLKFDYRKADAGR